MYLQDYIVFLAAILVCMIISGIASGRVRSTFAKHNNNICYSRLTGRDTVLRLMNANGVKNISVGAVRGFLTDHYHPTKAVVNLSESTYSNNSVAAVAVAAHEMGHVMQKQKGYAFYKLRTALVPVVNFGTGLAMPLVLVGLLLDLAVTSADSNVGFYIAMVGVILYGGALLFALVTLPVELNASRRAKKMLLAEGIISDEELPAVSEVLSAAAMTYLASLLTSLVYFMRFLLRVLTLFGRRNNR